MKKLVFGVFAVLITAFLLPGFKNKSSKPRLPATVQQTLDGVDELTARQMINNFANNYDLDTGPKSVSIFYPISQINTINNLLIAENANASIATTGVRFYLGSNQPLDGATKLNVSILMVSTMGRQAPNSNHSSTNGDYYIHAAGILSTTEIGVPTDDNGAGVLKQGGLLYGANPPAPSVLCSKPSPHYLAEGLAYSWVQKRYENSSTDDPSAYNTKSEFFSYCFINSLFTTLINNNYSGLRVYLGEGTDKNGNLRDLFILVPTKLVNGQNQDDYDCLENLNPNFCRADSGSSPHFTNGAGGGYDEGELCPDVCD